MTEDGRAAGLGVKALAAAFAVLAFALSIFRFLDGDELEHVHSAWHVLNGALPYVDFFEHHHPLLWYLLAPVLALTGESAHTIVLLRLGFFLLVVATARATYTLALECRASREAAWLSVFLLLSMTTFVYVAIEIRPDVPQTLFGVVSARYFVRMLRTRAARDAVLSGFFAAVAFLFLQKAVLLLALYPAPFVIFAVRRQLPWRLGLYAVAAFAAACAPFAAFLLVTGSFDDYLVTNWLLNARVGAGRAAVSFLDQVVLRDAARNVVFWVLSLAMGAAVLRRKLEPDFTLPAWFGFGLVALIFAGNRVVDRYLVAAVPFLAVAVGMWLAGELERRRVRGLQLAAVLVMLGLVPGVAMTRSAFRSNRGQLEKIQFVLDRSQRSDQMYDQWRDFNLFRPDMHYFWFMTRPGVRLYNGLTGGRFAGYDVCRLIATVKPRFVSDRAGHLERCGLAGRYRPTPFDGLLELAPD
jgi:4-amino-4-deoxy-L-arabinose transferase-like glycosyltransferase